MTPVPAPQRRQMARLIVETIRSAPEVSPLVAAIEVLDDEGLRLLLAAVYVVDLGSRSPTVVPFRGRRR